MGTSGDRPIVAVSALLALGWVAVHAADTNFVSMPLPSTGPKGVASHLTPRPTASTVHGTCTSPIRIVSIADRGKLPPLMHAIVVVETVLDEAGQVKEINMLRAPSHAPRRHRRGA